MCSFVRINDNIVGWELRNHLCKQLKYLIKDSHSRWLRKLIEVFYTMDVNLEKEDGQEHRAPVHTSEDQDRDLSVQITYIISSTNSQT